MPLMEDEQFPGQQGGGTQTPPSGNGGDWFGNFSNWYSQMPNANSQDWSLQNLLEWQRQGQNMDPTFLQWADYFRNGGSAPPGAPGGGSGGGGFPGGNQGQGGGSTSQGPPPWIQQGDGWLDLFGGANWTPATEGFTSRFDEVLGGANSFGLMDLMLNNPSQSQNSWQQFFGSPTLMNTNQFSQGGSAYLDPSLMQASTIDPTMTQAAQMQAALTGGPSVSSAMQMAQGAQDVAQRGAMLQSGAAAQQLGNRRMNPAALQAVMGGLNREAGIGAASAAGNAFNTGINASLQTNLANQQARQQAGAQNASFQQQSALSNQAAQMQAALANQAAQMQAGGANQQAQNAAQQFNIGNLLQTQFANNGLQNQDRSDRMLAWQQYMGNRQNLGQFMLDWLLRGAWGQEGWIGG